VEGAASKKRKAAEVTGLGEEEKVMFCCRFVSSSSSSFSSSFSFAFFFFHFVCFFSPSSASSRAPQAAL